MERKTIGNKKVMPFTIPSGIVMTSVKTLEKLANEVPEIGVLTTKSIGPTPRAGNREPIFAQYISGGFVNAVGLANPGAEAFAEQLSGIKIPSDKFLLASVFGANAEEFVYVVKILELYVDGFELNLSCPHARGHGMALGQDPEIVESITRAITSVTRKPVFDKLTPNTNIIGEIAKAAMRGGAYGISAINTVGPGCYTVDGIPVLSNINGGMSGRGILPMGIKSVRDIRASVGELVPIIGMGGIRTASDVEEYAAAGANVYGIGSALAGARDDDLKNYFSILVRKLNGEETKESGLAFLNPLKRRDVDKMRYQKVKVTKVIEHSPDLRTIVTDGNLYGGPGSFLFAWIPGVGEKPFSTIDNWGANLCVLERGEVSRALNRLKAGDEFYVRGPYGMPVDIPTKGDIVVVGGGCGIAGIYSIACKDYGIKGRNLTALLGAKDKAHIPFLEEFEKTGRTFVATENGEYGTKGFVTDLFSQAGIPRGAYFYNCGPKAMVEAVLPLELAITTPDKIYTSLDFMTKCGVGICGSCADERGRRTCVEGPFMQHKP